MTRALSDPITGWSFDCETSPAGDTPPDGGIVVKNVRHRSNNFARDIRLIGIRLRIDELEPSGKVASQTSMFVSLDAARFTVGALQELKPSPIAAPAAPSAGTTFLDRLKAAAGELNRLKLGSYFTNAKGNYYGYGVRTDYVATPSLFARLTNCEVAGLEVSQIFLFSTYDLNPPHEPSGALKAARCHPLTKYTLSPNPAVDRSRRFQRVASIRFDYRLHLSLDSKPVLGTATTAPGTQNAGLFRDNDAVDIGGGAVGILSGTAHAFSKSAFAAVEKPLLLEVTAPGVEQGLSAYSDAKGPHWGWDNLHWWGNRGAGTMISTPGAFHAAHMHWRWGAAGLDTPLRSRFPEIDTTGRPGTLPVGEGTAGALLVDPGIWIQSIRVAVTRDDPALDPDASGTTLEQLSREDWGTLFAGRGKPPDDISTGANLVCWYSAEVHGELSARLISGDRPMISTSPAKPYTSKPAGTVFLHGLFFAHEAEMTGLKVGDTAPLHWPDSESTVKAARQWFRDAG
jgi:hypothetical protein